ncbi:MAG: ABC transporter permease [Bacillota bacterium]
MRGRGWSWIALGALLFLALFLIYPVLQVTLGSLMAPDLWREFFTRAYYRNALWNSLWLSAAATAGSILLGVPLALLVARYQLPGKGLVRTLAVLALLSPPFIGAYAWVILLGRSGLITTLLGLERFSIYGPGGVLLVLTLHHFPYVFLLVSAALTRIDPSVEEAAETLGAPPWRRLLTVTLPLTLPAIGASGLLVFTSALADFGTPMLIGEGLRTLPVVAYNEFLSEVGGSTGLASISSLVMLGVALAVLGLQARALAGRSYATGGVRRPVPAPLRGGRRLLAAGFALLLTGVAALPQGVVLVTSFLRTRGPRFTGELGLDNYRLMWDRMGEAVIRTILYATTATAVMLLAGMLVGYLLVRRTGALSRAIDGLLVLAQILPGTVLGIGLIITWGRPPLPLAGTGTILVIAFIVRRIAYTVRAASAGVSQLSPAVEEASLALGAPPWRTFLRITAPLILPSALSGAIVSWISTIGELSSTIMLYTGRTVTISVLIYNQVLTDSFGTAAALGSSLIGLTLVTLWLLRRWSGAADPFHPS